MQQKNHFYILLGMMAVLFLSFIFPSSVLANNSASYTTDGKPSQFPTSAVDILRQDLSKQTSIAVEKLQLVEAVKETWPDGCLGLAKPDEFCSQALVDGWRVTFSDGSRRWSYRTEMNGQNYRLAQEAN